MEITNKKEVIQKKSRGRCETIARISVQCTGISRHYGNLLPSRNEVRTKRHTYLAPYCRLEEKDSFRKQHLKPFHDNKIFKNDTEFLDLTPMEKKNWIPSPAFRDKGRISLKTKRIFTTGPSSKMVENSEMKLHWQRTFAVHIIFNGFLLCYTVKYLRFHSFIILFFKLCLYFHK